MLICLLLIQLACGSVNLFQSVVFVLCVFQVMAFGLFLMDTRDGPNIYKMDTKKRINISKIDRLLKVSLMCCFIARVLCHVSYAS